MMAAAFQPVSALSFMTDGIHWGTGDYGFLRNAVVLATLCGAAGLFLPGQGVTGDLTWIWAVTGFWIAIRAILGVIRIWPGIGRAPLAP
jgi:MATE family multidrug resistance protein